MAYQQNPGTTGNMSEGGEFDNFDKVTSAQYPNAAAGSAAAAARSATAAAESAADAAQSLADIGTSVQDAEDAAAAAALSAANAATSATNASGSASTASNAATNASTSATSAATSADTATTQATNAAGSATSASTSATNAAASQASATTSATNAANSATTATTQATSATNSATSATASASAASTSATNAATSATSAGNSATSAASSATSATNSATSASTSATNAAASASSASTSATNAAASQTSATNSATSASTSATNAANSATSASTSAATATTAATSATTSATNAATSAANALTSENNASTYATNAFLSASNASSSATSASGSASSATTSASNAYTSEVNAATSATNSANSASSASTSATSASGSATSASTSATNAANSATAAGTSATNASNSATAAGTSETNAANSASNAATSASSASTSATNAANSASAASTSETNAANSATSASASATSASSAQTAAEAARDQALAAFDNFDDKYLGEKTSDPTVDNDGNPLQTGALYFNSVSNVMKVYTGTAWVAAYVSGAGYLLATNNLSELTSFSTARTNLGLGTAATTNSTDYATSAQGTLADTALQSAAIGVSIQAYNANTVIDASYVHTDNNYTTTEKSKLAGIEAGAEVNVNADWNSSTGDSQILNKPTLGTASAENVGYFATAAQGALIDNIVSATNEPIGFVNRADSNISFNSTTRVFTITPVGASFEVWCKGVKHVITSAQTVTIPNTTNIYYIYFSSLGVLSYKTTYFTWDSDTPTAYVYWNATTSQAVYFADERHGTTLDWATHEYLHRTRGAAIANGFAAGGYTLGGTGANNSDAEISIEGGTFFDEDLEVTIVSTATPTANTWEQDLLFPAKIPVLRLDGTAWVLDTATDFPLKQGTARPQYNLFSGGVWSTADAGNNDYTCSWIIATNNLNYPVMAIISQSNLATLANAQAARFEELILTSFPSVEFRQLYKLIFHCSNTYTNTPHAILKEIYDLRAIASAGSSAALVNDHANLSGLSDDDHLQYIHVDNVRTISDAVKASFLPSQTSNSGKYLSTNGTLTSWSTVDALPSQTSQSGNYLTTDGTTASWAAIPPGMVYPGAGIPVSTGTAWDTSKSAPSGAIVGTTDSQTLTNKKLEAYNETVTTVGTVSTSTYNIDLSLSNIFDITLGNDVTFTFTNAPSSGISKNCTVILRQDSTGSRLATFTNAKYTDGVVPILSTGASQIDVLTFFTLNGGSFWFGTFAMANVS